MFNAFDYSKKIESRIAQLNERFAELQSNMQLIGQEMKFIELELAELNGQSKVLNIIKENSPLPENIEKQMEKKDGQY